MHSSTPPPNTFKMTAIAYVPAVVAMMTVGVLVPFIDRICADVSASRAEVGFAVALFSMPSAVLATMAGGLMDSYGLRRSMLYGAAVSALGSVLVSQARSLLALDVGMALAGLGFGALGVAMPCVIIATLRDAARIRAMSFASTFAPTGYAAGLLMAVPYGNSGAWRMAMLAHAALTAGVFSFSVFGHASPVDEPRAVATLGTADQRDAAPLSGSPRRAVGHRARPAECTLLRHQSGGAVLSGARAAPEPGGIYCQRRRVENLSHLSSADC